MPIDDSQPSDHEPANDHSRLDLSIYRRAVFGNEGLEVETTLTDLGIEVGHQRLARLDDSTSESSATQSARGVILKYMVTIW